MLNQGKALLLLTACLMGGCDPQPEAARVDSESATSADPSLPAEPSSPGDTADPMEAATAALVIEGEGLRVFLPSGASRPIPFGTTSDVARTAVASVLGAEPLEQGFSPDCNLGFSTWPGGLTTYASGERFVGWFLRPGDGRYTTASGIGIGSSRTELESVYVAEVSASSLGTEFSAGGLAGTLESADGGARITNLWAGETCIAR